MTKCGAFWLKKDKNGKAFMSGIIENDSLPSTEKIPVVVFKNKKKESEKQPDYLMFLSEPKSQKEDDVPF
ncbi:MAG: hypothetical protein COS40_08565 [Deltaproteobacteria bacterium CG03_land_8_20_14_0_80_45_14]|nr:MAG: hypothetical protein COS40_08565 [Deltaproteobacteria bacterium CG03_land_8_20_14_0_80_45_14]